MKLFIFGVGKSDDIKVGQGHESGGCHKTQLLPSLATFRNDYKITLSWSSHLESLKLYFC